MLGLTLLLALTAGPADNSDWPPKPPAAEAPKVAVPAAPTIKEGQTILVLDLTVGPDVRPELPRTLSDQLALQVRQENPAARVLGMEDVRTMLALQAARSRLNCQDVSCLAEIGGALGAKEVVNGSLSRIGDNFVLTIKRVNAKRVRVIADATRQVARGHEGELIDALKVEVAQLFPKATANADALFEEEAVSAPAQNHSTSYLLLAGGAVGIAALITGAVLYGQFQSAKSTAAQPNTAVPVGTISTDHGLAVAGCVLMFAGAAVAAGGALGGVLAW